MFNVLTLHSKIITSSYFLYRESLCHVLRVKMERYKKERKGSQEVEEYLKTLLDNEVKPLWPKGWMQSRYLTLVQIHTFSYKNLVFILFQSTSQPDCTCSHTLSQHLLFQGADKGEQENVKPL